MAGKIEQAEWRADCLKARMDAFAAADADDAGKTYTEIRKRAERRGWEATVTANGVTVSNGAKTKTVRTHAELEAFMGTRGDADDPCWEGYEQRGMKEKGGETVPNCVKADAITAADYKKLVNRVDYAIQTLQSARNSEVESASRDLMQALAQLNQSDLPRGKPEEVDYMKRSAQALIQKRKGDIGKKD